MNSRDLVIGDIIKVFTGKNEYEVEILNKTPASIKYKYIDLPKSAQWESHENFDKMFKILKRTKEGSGKIQERIKRVYTPKKKK